MKRSTIIILIIVVIVAAGAYFYFEGSPASLSGDSLLQADSNAQAEAAGAQVLILLNQIQSLSIDTSLFSDPGWNTLVDYTVPIPPENVGRSNPFAPIPGVNVGP